MQNRNKLGKIILCLVVAIFVLNHMATSKSSSGGNGGTSTVSYTADNSFRQTWTEEQLRAVAMVVVYTKACLGGNTQLLPERTRSISEMVVRSDGTEVFRHAMELDLKRASVGDAAFCMLVKQNIGTGVL